MIFIGIIEATISSPSGVTERAEREIFARAFLKGLQEKINRRNNNDYSIEFRLISTQSGCIILKAAAFLVAAGTAGLIVLKQDDAARITNYLRGTVDTWIECQIEHEEWACRLQKLDISFGTKFHKIVEGDTLESVLRDRFNVKRSDMATMMKLTEEWYSSLLIDKASKQLKPGYFIAQLRVDMPFPPKSPQQSQLH